MTLLEPTRAQVLDFCALAPVERVFLEDAARRAFGRFAAVTDAAGLLTALCHVGANVVPSGEGSAIFADLAVRANARMIIGEERAVTELWEAGADRLPPPREARPAQPVYALGEPPEPGGSGLRLATLDDVDRLVAIHAGADEAGSSCFTPALRRGGV